MKFETLRKFIAIATLSVLIILAGFVKTCEAKENTKSAVDFVLINGTIYTMDAARTEKEAIAVKDGLITFVGSSQEAKKLAGETTRVIDLKGKLVLPGLIDSHVHLVDGGVHLNECNLDDCKTAEQALATVKKYCRDNPDLKWIRGAGWSLPLFKTGNPGKEALDKIEPNRPVFLESQDYHSAWVNSKALELAGITASTKNPPGGIIEKESNTGTPSGTLRESAIDLVSKLIPPRNKKDYIKGLKLGQKLANKFGITAIQDASVNSDFLGAYQALNESGELTVKVQAAMKMDPEKQDEEQIAKVVELADKINTPRLKVTSAKIFADGVIEAKTAVLINPYNDKEKSNGEMLWEPERMKTLVSKLESKGIQVHVHAIGDGAVREALDSFEYSRTQESNRKRRSHIAHLEMIDESDLIRFQKLGVGATIQAYWAQKDKYISELTEPVLGKARSKNLYPLKSLRDAGARLVGGSDWPVTTLNPFNAIQVAITRRSIDKKENSWLPHQKLILKDCLEAYTINGAYTNHLDSKTGSLEVGKAADLIVLDQNLFLIPPEEIHKTRVLLTILEGDIVYRDPN